jgi:hypothetical protein
MTLGLETPLHIRQQNSRRVNHFGREVAKRKCPSEYERMLLSEFLSMLPITNTSSIKTPS